jgi:hypothetical protein
VIGQIGAKIFGGWSDCHDECSIAARDAAG